MCPVRSVTYVSGRSPIAKWDSVAQAQRRLIQVQFDPVENRRQEILEVCRVRRGAKWVGDR
jgi:hypothetical protein